MADGTGKEGAGDMGRAHMTVDVNGVTSSRGVVILVPALLLKHSARRSGDLGRQGFVHEEGLLVELEVDLCFQCVAKY